MKKRLLIVAVLVLSSLSLWAGIDTILSVKTYFDPNNIPPAGFNYDGSEKYVWKNVEDPEFWNNLDSDWWMKRQDYWLDAYDKTSFLDLGFEAHLGNFLLVTRMDLMQDVLVNLQNPASLSTNLPFIGNLIDLTLPRLGFVEWESEGGNFFISLGRRLIKWGPGTYDLTLSDSQPYLDNIWTEFKLPLANDWNFDFNYIIISPKMWMDYNDGKINDVQKTIFAHKWSFYNNNFRITIGELNNIYGKDPNFLDASPLIIWHDSNQDDYSNVFLHLILEGKVGPVRAFGGFAMDDFDLPHETGSAKPMAMGFSAGVEYHVFDGEGIGDAKFDRRDYTLREETFKVENGLNVGAEWYHLSPLMYNRREDIANGAGKFTIPFQFVSLVGEDYVYYNDAYYLGFKYGPDSSLFRFYAEYTDAPIEAKLSVEYLVRGQYGIESKYGDRSAIDSHFGGSLLALAGNKTSVLLIDADFAYYLQEAFKVNAGIEWQQDLTHSKSAYKLTIGASINPLDVDWKNLF